MLTTFQSFTNPVLSGKLNIDQYVELIKNNRSHSFTKDSYEYKRLKANSPCVTINATFDDKPSYNSFVESSGLMFADIDNVENVEQEKQRWFQLPFVAIANQSLSKSGIHLVLKLDDQLTQFINAEPANYSYAYEYISRTYFEKSLCPGSKKVTQYTVIPSDANILYKEASALSIPIDKIIPAKPVESDEARLEHIFGTGLRYKDYLPSKKFASSNLPIVQERWVYDINLKIFKKFRVKEGRRRYTLSGLCVRLMGLNSSADQTAIEFELKHLNGIICEVPLTESEVETIVNNNFKAKESGVSFAKYRKKIVINWSEECTLNGHERKYIGNAVLSKYKKESAKKKCLVWIQHIMNEGREKVTQKRVSELSGISPDTLQKKPVRKRISGIPVEGVSIWNQLKHHFKEYNTAMSEVLTKEKRKAKKGANVSIQNKPIQQYTIPDLTVFSEHPVAPFCTFSESKIAEAIDILMKKRQNVSQVEVVRLTGLSIRTVKTYWKNFKDRVSSYKKSN